MPSNNLGTVTVFVKPAPYGLYRFCDVSKWQSDMNWSRAAVTLDFAYAKASQGTFTDTQWLANYSETQSIGFPLGMYHYYDNRINWKRQADYFLGLYDAYPTGLLPTVDLEVQTTAPVIADVLNFCADVMAHIGTWPIIYSGPNYILTYLGKIPEMSRFPLWISHYATDKRWPLDAPRVPLPWFAMDWWGWQFSADGNGQGKYYGAQSTAIDLNVAWSIPRWPA